jgi:hypothetical protein
MHEKPETSDRIARIQWRGPHYAVSTGLLVFGLIAGRAFFPLEVPKPFIVEKEKRVEVPVERVVVQKEPFEVIKYVDRVVEKRVEVPVEKIVEKRVEVPIEKIVEKRVEVPIPVERVVYRDRQLAPSLVSWRSLMIGMSQGQVRAILGEPLRVDGGDFTTWYYSNKDVLGPYVRFYQSRLDSWKEP